MFKTIKPASKLHLLVTPRKHIQNLDSLIEKKDAKIVEDMIKVGEIAIKIADGRKSSSIPIQYCFHVPPYNSIDHLHLHAIAYPNEMNPSEFIKYNTYYMPYCELAQNTIKRLLDSEF